MRTEGEEGREVNIINIIIHHYHLWYMMMQHDDSSYIIVHHHASSYAHHHMLIYDHIIINISICDVYHIRGERGLGCQFHHTSET